MNKKNAINHAFSKLNKFKLNPKKDGKAFNIVVNKFHNIPSDYEIYYCNKCNHEDFGYCGLRRSDLSDEDIFIKFCCNAMIEILKYELRD